MSRRGMGIALLALSVAPLAAQKKPVTIAAVADRRTPKPGLEPVTWAPDGTRFFFERDNQIWSYTLKGGESKALVSLESLENLAVAPPAAERFDWQNRGVSEPSLQVSPKGGALLLRIRGDLFLHDLSSGQTAQLTATPDDERDPKLAPDEKTVAFRRNHDLYALSTSDRKVTRLTSDGSATLLNGELDWVYPEELALGTAYWWSPDSRKLAFLQFDISREPVFPQVDLLGFRGKLEPQRYPKAGDPNADVRLGVIALDSKRLTWLDTGQTRDHLLARVDWAPDSKAIAVQRLNRIQTRLDLLMIDAGGAAAPRLILREEDRYWVNLLDYFQFLEDGRKFLWGSERDGFAHLYRYRIDGTLEQRITKGDWVVTGVSGVDEERGKVYFTSTEKSPLERHLYEAGLDGKRMKRLTAKTGAHTISMSPAMNAYLETHSNRETPPNRTLFDAAGKQLAVYREPDRTIPEQFELLPVELVTVKTTGGETLHARLVRPKNLAPGAKAPVIVLVYGGPHAQNVTESWGGLSMEQAFAQKGYVVWQLDNRGTFNRGHKFETAVFRNLGAQELEDQKAGIEHLASLGIADTTRMGIHGWSYGGFMTMYALTKAPDLFRSGAAGAPVTHWRNYDTIYTERYMGLPEENADNYKASSPVENAAALKARLLILHNIGDDNVHYQNTQQLAEALQKAGKRFEMMIYPQKEHGVTGPLRKHLLETLEDFFDRTLK